MDSTPTARAVPEALLQADNLPSLPTVAVQVLTLCRQEDTTLDDLAECIAGDPALAAKMLRYANSPAFSLGQEVTTLQRATLVLGQKSVQLMALSFSLTGSLPREGGGFDFDTFWRRSLARAVAARSMMGLVGRMGEEETFLCGLLSGIGQLVLARCFEPYGEVFAHCGERWPTTADELEVLGFHRGDVGQALLSAWSLPPSICLGVGFLDQPDQLPADSGPQVGGMVEILSLSGLAVEALLAESGEALLELERRLAEAFQLGQDEVGAYLLALEAEFKEASRLLDMPMPTTRSHQEILDEARSAMLTVGMESMGQLRESHHRELDLCHRTVIPAEECYLEPRLNLLNSAGFEEFLLCEAQARMGHSLPQALGVLVLEVDRYEELRAGQGQEACQEVLGTVARVLGRMTRSGDVAAHLDGPRFAVIVPETSPFGLRTLAERIRHGVQMQAVPTEGRDFHVSVSMGGACVGRVSRVAHGEALVEASLRYMARAQRLGGNGAEVHASVVHHD